MSSSYQVRLFVPEDRSVLEDLYRAVYGQAWREKTNLGWTLDHPLVEGGASLVVEGSVVASAQPYCDLPLHTPWGDLRATLFLDVATHPAHRRRGLFRRVVAAARTAAFDRGASIIITTPNRLSLPGFQSMQEWVQLCSLDCLFLPLRANASVSDGGLMSLGPRMALAAASLLGKGPPDQANCLTQAKCEVESPWSPDADADKLWDRTAGPTGIIVMRDRAFLQWRFGADYQLFLARDSRRPLGYAAARVITRAGLRVGMVLDCVTVGDEVNALPLLTSVVAWLKEQGASAAMGYFLRGSAPWRQVRAAGFLPLPRLLLPRDYPVCASIRPGDPHGTDLLNPACWQMSLADSDLA